MRVVCWKCGGTGMNPDYYDDGIATCTNCEGDKFIDLEIAMNDSDMNIGEIRDLDVYVSSSTLKNGYKAVE